VEVDSSISTNKMYRVSSSLSIQMITLLTSTLWSIPSPLHQCLRSYNMTSNSVFLIVPLVHLPDLWLLLNEPIHQILTLLALHNHDLNASLFQIGFAAKEGLILSNHNTGDTIEDTRPGTVRVNHWVYPFKESYHISQGESLG